MNVDVLKDEKPAHVLIVANVNDVADMQDTKKRVEEDKGVVIVDNKMENALKMMKWMMLMDVVMKVEAKKVLVK